jgi:hypothetical protein
MLSISIYREERVKRIDILLATDELSSKENSTSRKRRG